MSVWNSKFDFHHISDSFWVCINDGDFSKSLMFWQIHAQWTFNKLPYNCNCKSSVFIYLTSILHYLGLLLDSSKSHFELIKLYYITLFQFTLRYLFRHYLDNKNVLDGILLEQMQRMKFNYYGLIINSGCCTCIPSG